MTAFTEETGQGYLRHIAISIQRHTNLVQLVLVWNSLPPTSISDRCSDDANDVAGSHAVLERFREALLRVPTTSTIGTAVHLQWHSIWVHYNNSWKHANAIFTHDGIWRLLYQHNEATAKMKDDSLSIDSIINNKWNHICPIGGITEYLTTNQVNNMDSTNRGASVIGKGMREQQLPHVPLHFPPQVFRQGNITAFTKIVQSIRNFILEQFYVPMNSAHAAKCKPSCLELYGGVGTIGLHIVDLCSRFVCSDENPHNVQCFNATVNAVIESMKTRNGYYPTYDGKSNDDADEYTLPSIRYESSSASVMVLDRMEHMNDVDIIIVDPPRKGMDTDVCHALTTAMERKKSPIKIPTKAKKNSHGQQPMTNDPQQVLIYVSCGFDAFVRDYQILTQSSTMAVTSHQSKAKTRPSSAFDVVNKHPWNLIHAEGHVLFPGSDAIETLAIFTRTKYPTPNR